MLKQTHQRSKVARFAALVALLAAVSAGLWVLIGRNAPLPTEAPEMAKSEPLELITASGTHHLAIEVARTPAQQAFGLMYRTELASDTGMLFVHGRPREVKMWMKNTYIPLDMVFITADGTVHRIAANTEPHSQALISSQGPVSAVLEIAGGAAARYGLKAGDKVRHPLFATQ